MSDPSISVSIDSGEAQADLDRLEDAARQQQAEIVQGFRQTAELGILLAEVAGANISELHRLYVQTATRAIEVALEARAVLAAGTLGTSEVLALALQTAAVASLTLTIIAIQQDRADFARRTRALSEAFRMITFTLCITPTIIILEVVLNVFT